jgi:hypothetical protein
VVELVESVHITKAEVHLLDIVSPRGRLGVESVLVVLSCAIKDGCTSKGDANHTKDVARLLSKAKRCFKSSPVPSANLAVEDCLGVDGDWSRVDVLWVEVDLDVNVVLLGL